MQKSLIITAHIRLAAVGSTGKASSFAASKFGGSIVRGLTSESDSVDSFNQNSQNQSDSNDQPSGKSASSKLRSTIDEATNTYLEMYPHMRQVSDSFKRKATDEEKKRNSNRKD